MVIRIYDTNLSYRFEFGWRHTLYRFDWWYDRGMRARWWIPLELWVCRNAGTVKIKE